MVKKNKLKDFLSAFKARLEEKNEDATSWVFKSKAQFIITTLIDHFCINSDDGILLNIRKPVLPHVETCLHKIIIMFIVYLPVIFSHYLIGHITHRSCMSIKKMMPVSVGIPASVTVISLLTAFYTFVVLRLSICFSLYMIYENGLTIFHCYYVTELCYEGANYKTLHHYRPDLESQSNYSVLSSIIFIRDFKVGLSDLVDLFSHSPDKKQVSLIHKSNTFIHFGVVFFIPVLIFFLASMRLRRIVKGVIFFMKAHLVAHFIVCMVGLTTPTALMGFELVALPFSKWKSLFSWKHWLLAINEQLLRQNPYLVTQYHLAAYLHPSANTEVVTVNKWVCLLILECLKSFSALLAVPFIIYRINYPLSKFDYSGTTLTFGFYPIVLLSANIGTIVLQSFFFMSMSILYITRMTLLLNLSYACISDALSSKRNYRSYFYFVWLFAMVITVLAADPDWLQAFLTYGLEPSLSLSIAVLSTWEATTIFYLYGTTRFADDFHFKVGRQPAVYFKFLWLGLPVIFLAVAFCVFFEAGYNPFFTSNPLALTLIYVPFVAIVGPLVLGCMYVALKFVTQRSLLGIITPTDEWGDPRESERIARKKYPPREECRFRRRYDSCNHPCLRYSKVLPRLSEAEYDLRLGLEEVAFEFIPLEQQQFRIP